MKNECGNCKYFDHGYGGMACRLIGKEWNYDGEKPEWCPLNKNCHEYCPYRKMCRYVEGSNGMDPDECAMYYKLDDLMNEARDIEREQRKALDDYDEWE